MAEPAKRQLILEALKARAEAITTRDGAFETDAGRSVHLHEAPAFGPDDTVPAIAMVVGEDLVEWHGSKGFVAMAVEFQVLAPTNVEGLETTPWRALERGLADVKRAIELGDRFLGGLTAQMFDRGPTRSLPREPGGETVGVGVTYLIRYYEAWGQPDL